VTINFTQFFDRFREICDTLIGIHTAQGTTIPALIDLLLAEYDTGTLEGNPITNGVVTAGRQNERQTQLASTLFQLANATLLEAVKADMPSAAISSTAAVTELIRQMRVGAETVKRNVVGGTPTPPDTSAPTLIVSTVDTQGRALEQIIAETLVGTGLVNGINLNLAGAISTASVQEHDWPTGSAISRNLAAVRPANGLVANPSFDNEDDRTNTPDDWIIHVGTVTTTVGVTDPEKQTVAISGTPTTGHYTLSWTLLDGSVVTTKPLVFNAAGADVQAALAALEDLSDVAVTTTGTSPNFTHTVTFNAVRPGGDQNPLTSANNFDTGTITIAEIQVGGQGATWKAMDLIGNGAQLHTIRQRVNLRANTQYALSVQFKKLTGTTGVIEVELVDGLNAVISDEAATNNRLTTNLTAISDTAFAAKTAFFRTPNFLPTITYLQFRASTAISNTGHLYVDDLILTPAVQLYRGGPYAALFENIRDLTVEDRYTLAMTNDRAGKLQSWFGRIFDRAVLPSAVSGSETIAD